MVNNIPGIHELLKHRNVKRGLIVVGAILVIYLWVASWLNKMQLTEQKIQQFWVLLKENTDRRVDILPQFVQLVETYAPQAEEVKAVLTRVYVQAKKVDGSEQILNVPQSAAAFTQAHQQVSQALWYMEQQAPRFPALAQNNQFAMLTAYVNSLNQQIEFSMRALEQQINYYNFQITTFPQNMINFVYPHYKRKYIVDFATANTTS